MRFMLSTGSTPGQDLRFHWEKVEQARNFANKIWNASRFALMNLEGVHYEEISLKTKLGTADHWILHRLNQTSSDITRLIEVYEFGEIGRLLTDFIWDDLCDWYIEFAKLSLYGDDITARATTQSVLAYVLEQTMRLIHPFMPFISEEIWQHLPHEGETIMLSPWPQFDESLIAHEAVKEMGLLMDIIRSVRNVRAEVNVPMSKKIELMIKPSTKIEEIILHKNTVYIQRFCNTTSLVIEANLNTPEHAMSAIVTGSEVYLPLTGLIDIQQEINRLEKELQILNNEVDRVDKKLANEGFVAKAPAHVINEEKAKQKDYVEKREKVLSRVNELKAL